MENKKDRIVDILKYTSTILMVLLAISAIVLYFIVPSALESVSAFLESIPSPNISIGNNNSLNLSLSPSDIGFDFINNTTGEFSINIWFILAYILLAVISVTVDWKDYLLSQILAFVLMLSPIPFLSGIMKSFENTLNNGGSALDAILNVLVIMIVIFTFGITGTFIVYGIKRALWEYKFNQEYNIYKPAIDALKAEYSSKYPQYDFQYEYTIKDPKVKSAFVNDKKRVQQQALNGVTIDIDKSAIALKSLALGVGFAIIGAIVLTVVSYLLLNIFAVPVIAILVPYLVLVGSVFFVIVKKEYI